ncbi:MAG: polyphosphate:AMP phosphotransferase [Defluviitaleaceae bacterium]|nr:polyphosphate:AMP phosphotransferase [Defluviitaleaceae bacterium]
MLSSIDPNQRMEKDEYKETIRPLEKTLTDLQQKVREACLPVVIVFEGWGASGKGTHISRLVNPLDPRYFDVRTTGNITDEKIMRPFLWSYWTYLPPKGQIVIMDKSWHRLILPELREPWQLSNMEVHGFYFDVNAFERQLADDGYLIIKLFMHISKDEQHRRFKALAKDPATSWRVKDHNWEQNKNYDNHLRQYEKMLKMTNTEENPWHVIEANDRKYGTCKMLRIIIEALKKRLSEAENPQPPSESKEKQEKVPRMLQSVSPDEDIPTAEYRDALEHYQQRMRTLSNKMYAKRRSAVIVYEGWDAAGKGGNIKRLTSEMDPRCYAVVPIGPPRPYELTRQHLWRFMVKMPKDGHLTIFDRSWYGRVLVERVEELTPPHIWKRAYREINEMEQHLVGHGMVMLKFWMHIDKDEQLRRFEDRQSDPSKAHKITEEDWRNREKWDLYEEAVDEMLMRTHTPHSPWIIVESNCKKHARVKVLQTVTDALEDALR